MVVPFTAVGDMTEITTLYCKIWQSKWALVVHCRSITLDFERAVKTVGELVDVIESKGHG